MFKRDCVDFKVEQKKLFAGVKDFNPNNKQPVIVDVDGTIVYESMAINLYLAKKYKDVNPDFAPKNMKEEAKNVDLVILGYDRVRQSIF